MTDGYVEFDQVIVLEVSASVSFDSEIYLGLKFDNTILLVIGAKHDNTILLLISSPHIVSVTVSTPPPSLFDEVIDAEVSYHNRYDNTIFVSKSTPLLSGLTITEYAITSFNETISLTKTNEFGVWDGVFGYGDGSTHGTGKECIVKVEGKGSSRLDFTVDYIDQSGNSNTTPVNAILGTVTDPTYFKLHLAAGDSLVRNITDVDATGGNSTDRLTFYYPNWFNADWTGRRILQINGTTAGAQTNYPMRVHVRKGTGTDSAGTIWADGCRDDFGDIRFTGPDGTTEIDYWRESYTSGVEAYFWVEVHTIPTSSTIICAYYGFASAGTTSNVANVTKIALGDTFDGTTIDAAKWNEVDANNYITQNDKLIISGGPSAYTHGISSVATFARPFTFQFKWRTNTTNTYSGHGIKDATAGVSYVDYPHWVEELNNGTLDSYRDGTADGALTGVTYAANTDYWWKYEVLATGCKVYRSIDGISWILVKTFTNSTETPLKVGFTLYSKAYEVDNVIVRTETASPEPVFVPDISKKLLLERSESSGETPDIKIGHTPEVSDITAQSTGGATRTGEGSNYLQRSEESGETPDIKILHVYEVADITSQSNGNTPITGKGVDYLQKSEESVETPDIKILHVYEVSDITAQCSGNTPIAGKSLLSKSEDSDETPTPFDFKLESSDLTVFGLFDETIVVYTLKFDETIFLGDWVNYDNEIKFLKWYPELISITLTFPPSSPVLFDEVIDVEKSYQPRYDETLCAVYWTPQLKSITLVLETPIFFDSTILLWKSETSEFDELITFSVTFVNEFDETILLGYAGISEFDEDLLTAISVQFDSDILCYNTAVEEFDENINLSNSGVAEFDEDLFSEISAQFDSDLLIYHNGASEFDETILLYLTGSKDFDEDLLTAISSQFDNEILPYKTAVKEFDEAIHPYYTGSEEFDEDIDIGFCAKFDATLLAYKTGSNDFNEIVLLYKTAVAEFDEDLLTAISSQFDEILFIYKTAVEEFDEVIIHSKSALVEFDEDLFTEKAVAFDNVTHHHKSYSNGFDETLLFTKTAVEEFDSKLLAEISIGFNDVIRTSVTVYKPFDDAIYVQAPETSFNEKISLWCQTRRYDDSIRLEVSDKDEYDETALLAHSASKIFSETMFVQAPQSPFDNDIFLVTAKRFDNKIYVQAPDSDFDSTIFLTWRKRFDDSLTLNKSHNNVFDSVINLACHEEFDEVIFVQMPSVEFDGIISIVTDQFDETIFLVYPAFDYTVFLRKNGTNNYDSTIKVQAPEATFDSDIYLLWKNSFDNTIKVQAPDSCYDSTVLVVKALSKNYDEKVVLSKSGVVEFDEDIIVANHIEYDIIIRLYDAPDFDERMYVQAPEAPFDSTVITVKSKQFDERIWLLMPPVLMPFDEAIMLDYSGSAHYDYIMMLEQEQIHTSTGFDETIQALSPNIVRQFDESIYVSRGEQFNELIFLYNSAQKVFDEKLYIATPLRFNSKILLEAPAKKYHNETIRLQKTYNDIFDPYSHTMGKFDETIFIGRKGSGTNYWVKNYDNRIRLTKNANLGYRFDEKIIIGSPLMYQILDP